MEDLSHDCVDHRNDCDPNFVNFSKTCVCSRQNATTVPLCHHRPAPVGRLKKGSLVPLSYHREPIYPTSNPLMISDRSFWWSASTSLVIRTLIEAVFFFEPDDLRPVMSSLFYPIWEHIARALVIGANSGSTILQTAEFQIPVDVEKRIFELFIHTQWSSDWQKSGRPEFSSFQEKTCSHLFFPLWGQRKL